MRAPAPVLLVAAAVGALAAACTDDAAPPDPTPSASPDPDRAVWAAAMARERALLAAYDAVAPAGTTAAQLWLLASRHHRIHLRELERLMSGPAPAESVATELVTPSASGRPRTALDDVASARSLLSAERASSEAGIAAVHEARDRALARTLAQIAASESQHAAALYVALREGLVRRVVPSPSSTP